MFLSWHVVLTRVLQWPHDEAGVQAASRGLQIWAPHQLFASKSTISLQMSLYQTSYIRSSRFVDAVLCRVLWRRPFMREFCQTVRCFTISYSSPCQASSCSVGLLLKNVKYFMFFSVLRHSLSFTLSRFFFFLFLNLSQILLNTTCSTLRPVSLHQRYVYLAEECIRLSLVSV